MQILIQPIRETFAKYRNYAKKKGFSFEILDFSQLNVLNDQADYQAREEFYQKELATWDKAITMHGAFIDINVYSLDTAIRQAARSRVVANLTTAQRIGASAVVFHTNFAPQIRNPRYLQAWIKENTAFWQEVTQEYGVQVLLENMWESEPSALKTLMDEVDSPLFKVCLDTGHFNIFSQASLSEWFDALGNHIAYYHFNDNQGQVDEHLACGEGTVNWEELGKHINTLNLNHQIKAVIEVANLDKVRESVHYLQEKGLSPF